MLTKEHITELKFRENNGIAALINSCHDAGSIVFILESLGRLPDNFQSDFLYSLLPHSHSQVRLNAVKNIGKLNGTFNIDPLVKLYKTETDTGVRREIVSSIGRQRKKTYKPVLVKFLKDEDPKIVCQAIRGLLVFEKNSDVEKHLKPLINHQNEMVRTIIFKKYFAEEKQAKDALPHTETYDFLKNTVVNADVLEALKFVPDESVHLTFTSPPYYNARDYSIYPSYKAYLEFLSNVFKEVFRITKEGRFFLLNTSPVIVPRVSRSHSSRRYPIPFDIHYFLMEMGWEFIDDIIWEKPEASVKNRIGGFQQHRKPLGYKPNPVTEYVMVYRKSTEKLLDWNMHQYNKDIADNSRVSGGFETSNIWKIDPSFNKTHSAIFPAELCKRVIQYYSYKGDLVFDPFGGSGTVGKTANSLDRLFFMTEQEPVYFEYMKNQQNSSQLFKEFNARFLTLEQFKEIAK